MGCGLWAPGSGEDDQDLLGPPCLLATRCCSFFAATKATEFHLLHPQSFWGEGAVCRWWSSVPSVSRRSGPGVARPFLAIFEELVSLGKVQEVDSVIELSKCDCPFILLEVQISICAEAYHEHWGEGKPYCRVRMQLDSVEGPPVAKGGQKIDKMRHHVFHCPVGAIPGAPLQADYVSRAGYICWGKSL